MIIVAIDLNADESTAPVKVLYLRFEETAGKAVIHAEFGAEKKSYTVSESPETLRQDFDKLYHRLEKVKATRSVIEKLLGRHEKPFYDPVSAYIDKADEIQFIIDADSIQYAFDLITFNNRPLFLHKPISFSASKQAPKQNTFSETWSGLAVSDPSADPDRGVKFLKQILPKTEYYNMKDLDYKQFKRINQKDITLLSLHGGLEKSGANMDLNDHYLFAKDIAGLRSRIVYLDSCQMGADFNFLTTLRENGNEYLIAPLLSNEAGDSSTKTIHYFFTHLSQGDSPAVAMHKAKIKMHDLYRKKKYERLLEKIFPFRVYRQ